MLKGISPLLSPELVKILMEMGHGDEIVLADSNFPAASMARRLARCDGAGVPALLEAVLALFPLDSYVAAPVALMELVPGDTYRPELWEVYRKIIANMEPGRGIEMLERQAFYERSKSAYAVVATGETGLYANILLKKGVVRI